MSLSEACSTIKLNDGNTIPWLAFGTGTALIRKDCEQQMANAIACGITHLDTAQSYGNEDSLGLAIARSGVPRSNLFVTTKFQKLVGEQTVHDMLNESLKKLGLEYVDLYMMHWPIDLEDRLEEVWKEMMDCQKEGLVRSIGVSNFKVRHMERLVASGIPPAVHQIEYHPYLVKAEQPLLDFQKQHGIVTAAFGGLSSLFREKGRPIDAVISSIRDRLEKTRGQPVTDAQVLLKWLYQKGMVAVTTSSKAERVKEYLDVANVPDLSPEEMQVLDDVGSTHHFRALRQAMGTRAAYLDEA